MVDPLAPAPEAIADAARILSAGGLVAFPTETFYGLGADPWNERAVDALYRAKGRPDHLPILLLLAGEDQVSAAATGVPAAFDVLARRFWPGPLTLVVPACATLPARVGSGSGTIGLRVPPAPIPRALARAFGRPITGTSANLTGAPPARDAAQVAAALGGPSGGIDLLVDGGEAPGGEPSTVVDLTGPAPRLVRAGAIPFEAVQAALGGGV